MFKSVQHAHPRATQSFFFWISHREHPLSVRRENCLGKVIVWFYVRCRRDGDNFEHKLYGSGRRGSRVRPVWSGQDVWPSLPSAVFPKRVLPLARRGRVTLSLSWAAVAQPARPVAAATQTPLGIWSAMAFLFSAVRPITLYNYLRRAVNKVSLIWNDPSAPFR